MEARKEQQSLPGNRPWTVWGETSQTRKIQTGCVFVSHIPTSHVVIIASISISDSERNASDSRVDGLKIKVFMAFSSYYLVLALRKGRVQILLGASAGLMNYKHVRRSWQNNGIQKQKQVLVGCVSFWGKVQHFTAFWHMSTLSDGRGLLNELHRRHQINCLWLYMESEEAYCCSACICRSYVCLCIFDHYKQLWPSSMHSLKSQCNGNKRQVFYSILRHTSEWWVVRTTQLFVGYDSLCQIMRFWQVWWYAP